MCGDCAVQLLVAFLRVSRNRIVARSLPNKLPSGARSYVLDEMRMERHKACPIHSPRGRVNNAAAARYGGVVYFAGEVRNAAGNDPVQPIRATLDA